MISDTSNGNNRNNAKRKRGDDSAKDKKLSTDRAKKKKNDNLSSEEQESTHINGEDEDDNDDNDEDDDGNISWVFNVHDLDQLAQAKLDSMLKKIANPNIKSILKCFDINDYKKRGGGETKDWIHRTIESWSNRRDEIKNTIKAISRNEEKLDVTKSMDTYDLIDLLMYKMNKKMPRKCEECTKYYNEPINPL